LSGAPSFMPEGRRGQIVAAGLLVAAIGLVWLVVAAPLLDWYDARAERLVDRKLMLTRMTQIAAGLPALRQQSGKASSGAPPATALLGGDTDAVAGAALQGVVQDIATAAGATLASAEALPGEQQGAFRRIGLRVTLHSDWTVLMAMLQAVDESQLRLLVDDVQLHSTAQPQRTGPSVIEASFVVLGFRPGRESRSSAPNDLRADAGSPG
jgi:general secretion pathway protein M